jgi:hypothetical protein
MKPFSTLAGLLLLVVAAAHAYRLYSGMEIDLNGTVLPMWVSWVGLIVPGVLGAMVLVESRR